MFVLFPRIRCINGIIFFIILGRLEAATSIQASCIKTNKVLHWYEHAQDLKICEPNITTVDDKDFTILNAEDPTIQAFNVDLKDNFTFLPTNLRVAFPELLAKQVSSCPVTLIDKNHFKGLSHLKALFLDRNQIKNIASDAFRDLVSLEYLNLAANNIQSLHPDIFSSL